MPPYNPDPRIFEISIGELEAISRWISEREGRHSLENTFLIGGWAVYAYNPTLKSVDIDLITNSSTRSSLKHYLRTERGYHIHSIGIFNTVAKSTPYGDIIVDFATTSDPCKFYGRAEELSFRELIGRSVIRPLNESLNARVPERSLLTLYKLKASWDRKHRVEAADSHDVEWEYGKMVKDYADIIALLDPNTGGRDIDLNYLGEKLSEMNFLIEHLFDIPKQAESIERYGRLSRAEVKSLFDSLSSLI
ncbi:MAG: hypothetical protein WBZ29_13635 [Methanocella sp.]